MHLKELSPNIFTMYRWSNWMSYMDPDICTINVIIDKGTNNSTCQQELLLVDRHFFLKM